MILRSVQLSPAAQERGKDEENDGAFYQNVPEVSFPDEKYEVSVYTHLLSVWTGGS